MAEFTPTDEQQAVLDHDVALHGRVLAGPGTGKSATVVTLAQNRATSGTHLRLLTFTRAATAELARKVGAGATEVERPSTIHSFAIGLISRNPGAAAIPQPLRLADEWEERRVLRPTLARRLVMGVRLIDNLIAELAANWESLSEQATVNVTLAQRAAFVAGWREHREILGYTLLAELPFAAMRALEEHHDLAGADFDLLIVDEYQDLNACDLRLLRLLRDRGSSILAVGDDDQSIYSFRKAAPEGIRRFVLEYPGAQQYPLTVTHRFGERILDWASYVIEGDSDRLPRDRVQPAPGSPAGDVALLRFDSALAEARGIAGLAEVLRAADVPQREIVVLLRSDFNRAFSEPIRAALEAAGFTVTDPDYADELFARPHNRSALEMLRLATDRNDSIAWAALLELEPKIGDTFFDYVYTAARRTGERLGPTLLSLRYAGFPDGPRGPARAAASLVDSVLPWLDDHSVDPGVIDDWVRVLTEVGPLPRGFLDEEAMTMIREVAEIVESTSLSRFLGQLIPLAKDIATSLSEGVRIMTMGGSKGLTVEAAIVAGLEDGVVPRPGRDRSEERRLLYVAMTRARRFVRNVGAAKKRPGGACRRRRARLPRSYHASRWRPRTFAGRSRLP